VFQQHPRVALHPAHRERRDAVGYERDPHGHFRIGGTHTSGH
jgi:hypothetical protein